jgi:hypothetical protein
MPDKDIFGLDIEPSEEEITSEPVETEETPEAESPVDEGQPRDEHGRFVSTAPAEDPAAEEPEPETPAEPELSVADQQEITSNPNTEVAAEEPAEEAPRLYANKYQTPEDLERGYNDSREMWRRANEARKVEAAEKLQLQEQYAALYRQMESAVPILQQAAQREEAFRTFAEKYRQQYGDYPEGYTPPAPPSQQGPQDVQAIVDQRLAAERAAWQAQMEEQQQMQALQWAVQGLYESHPELDPDDTSQYVPIYDAVQELSTAWERYGIEVDPADHGSLEIAYEASKDPALLEVLKLNPAYFESAYGMELARRDAAVISGRVPATTEPRTEAKPASQLKASGARKPYVESAATGASSPNTEDENDPWVRVKNADITGGSKPGSRPSPFFE